MKDKKTVISVIAIILATVIAITLIVLVGLFDFSFDFGKKEDVSTTDRVRDDEEDDDSDDDDDDFELEVGFWDWYDHDAAPVEEEYGALENGDTFYTPDGSHLTFDDGRAVLYYNNMIIVYTFDDLNQTELDYLADMVDGEIVGLVKGGIHSVQIRVEDTDLAGLEGLCATLMEDDLVMYACAEYPVQIMGTENNPWDDEEIGDLGDETYPDGSDWWAEAIGAYTAWEYSDQCQELNIGVVDTGVDDYHEDLYGKVAFIGENTIDSMDHGTHVAGIMSADDNDIGIRGIADKLNLYSADLWTGADSDSSFHTLGELMAIYNNMAYNDVRVINNSWGCYVYDEMLYGELSEGNSLPYDEWYSTRIEELVPTAEATIVMMSQLIASGNENMIFVQAAGNGYYGFDYTPADSITNGFFGSVTEEVYDGLDSKILNYLSDNGISYTTIDERIFNVTATDYSYYGEEISYEIAYFANYGDTVDICAPGTMIYSTMNTGYSIYDYCDGTSMAAPIVTASIGYVWSLDPDMSVTEVREIILSSAEENVSCEIDGETYTYPMVNVGNAAQMVIDE